MLVLQTSNARIASQKRHKQIEIKKEQASQWSQYIICSIYETRKLIGNDSNNNESDKTFCCWVLDVVFQSETFGNRLFIPFREELSHVCAFQHTLLDSPSGVYWDYEKKVGLVTKLKIILRLSAFDESINPWSVCLAWTVDSLVCYAAVPHPSCCTSNSATNYSVFFYQMALLQTSVDKWWSSWFIWTQLQHIVDVQISKLLKTWVM